MNQKENNKYKKAQLGFSVVEIILAAAIFLIFSSGAIFLILQGLDSNRLAEEETIAHQYATEGIEAVRSIRNQNYSSVANTAAIGIVRNGSGLWELSGTNNTFGKYTRVLSIESVGRDGSDTIMSSGGTPDPSTKKVTATVTWNVTPSRTNSVVLTTYLTNWEQAIATATPTPTPTVSVTATPTPGGTCANYCTSLGGYSTGVCRQNAVQCGQNNETHESGGDAFCTGGASADTCCCK